MGDIVVIMGVGQIGCFHAQLAKLQGASKVIMVEIDDNLMNMTKKFGAEELYVSLKLKAQEENIRLLLIEVFRDIIVHVKNEGLFKRISIPRRNIFRRRCKSSSFVFLLYCW